MKKLIFDVQITGHHTEYISHLVDYLFEHKDDYEYVFVVHPYFSAQFPTISDKAKNIKNVSWVEITSDELNSTKDLGMIKKSFVEFRLMHQYALKFSVSHVYLLYFNTFQLACCFFRTKYTMSGILFLQFFRMTPITLGDKLRYYRKYLTTWLYSKNSKIVSVFVLNDEKSATFLNTSFHTNIFKMLPDPIPVLIPLENFNIYEHYGIDQDRKIFLHIGGLGDRKGTFEILESVKHIDLENQSKIAILLVGKVSSEYVKSLIQKGLDNGNSTTRVQMLWDNQFVSNSMMKSLFLQSEIILIPYKNAEASSGILGHAVAANKKVIATGRGLLKEIIEENKLGVLLEKVTPSELAFKIQEALRNNYSLDSESNSFLEEHTTQKFAALLLYID